MRTGAEVVSAVSWWIGGKKAKKKNRVTSQTT